MADQTIPTIKNLRGNIGIGTASPDRKVVIEAGSGYPLKVNSTQDYMISLSRSGTEQWWLKAYSNGDFAIHENGVGDQLHIDAGGKVGLGTSAPAQKLHIKGDRLRIEESVNARHLDIIPAVSGSSHIFTSSTTGSGYTFQNSSGTIAILDANGSAFYQDLTIASSNLKLSSAHYVQFGSANARIQGSNGSNYLKFYTGGVERLAIGNLASTFSGNVIISGGLTVQGTTTTIDSTTVSVDDKNIELGSVATPTDTTADGGGITLKGTTDYTINWSNSTDSWHFNQGIVVGENDTGYDVKFYGATSNRYLHWNQAEDRLNLRDNTKFSIGNSNDLQLEFNGTHGYIKNNVGGSLYIQTANTIQLENASGQDMLTAASGGAVKLFHGGNATAKFETTSDGAKTTGNYTVTGTATFGNQLHIFQSGNNNFISSEGTNAHLFIRNVGGGNTIIQGTTNENAIVVVPNGAVTLYHDNATKLSTTAAGVSITGGLNVSTLTLNGSVQAGEVNFITQGINSSAYTMLCTVSGNRLASIIDMTITGTSNSVVLNSSFEILVNHYQDIHVKSVSGDYREVTLRITSDNDENFSIEAKHNGTTTTEVEVCIFPRAGETITPTSTDPNYTGTEYEHTATEGWRYGGEDNNVESSNVIIDGKVGIGTTAPSQKLDISAGNIELDSAYAIQWGGTANKIWGSHGNNYIKIETNSVERLRIDSSGNVGIGTTSPSHKLHVSAEADGDYVGRITNTEATAGANYGLKIDGGSNASDVALEVSSLAGTHLFEVRGDGNVGIGTTTPSQKLEVAGDIFINGGPAGGRSLQLQRTGATNPWKLVQGHTQTDYFEILEGSDTRFLIKNGGNVGIGTSTVNSGIKLQVAGGVYTTTGYVYAKFIRADYFSSGQNLELQSGGSGKVQLRTSNNVQLESNNDGCTRLSSVGSTTGGKFLVRTYGGDDYLNVFSSEHSSGALCMGYGAAGKSGASGFVSTYDNFAGHKTLIKINHNGINVLTTSANQTDTVGADLMMTNRFTVQNDKAYFGTGNVGIGNTNPSQKLSVTGNISLSGVVLFNDNNGINFGNSNAKIYGSSSDGIKFNAGNAEAMRLTQTGQLGINTTSPSEKLHVEGRLRLGTTPEIVSHDNIGIVIDQNANSGADYFYIKSGTTERLRLTGSGNLGIGTSSPDKQLHVRGSAPYIRIEESSASEKRLDLYVDPSSAIAYVAANQSAQQLSFQTASTDRIRIANNGNVGIGTTSPSDKLHVVGSRIRLSSNAGGYYGYNTSGGFRFALYDNNSVTRLYGDGNGNDASLEIDSNKVGLGCKATANSKASVFIKGEDTTPTLNGTAVDDASLILTNSYTTDPYGLCFGVNSSGTSLVQSRRLGSETYFMLSLNPYGGNVGIGTTTPDTEFQVEGLIKQKVYTVSQLPTPSSTMQGVRAFVSDSSISPSGNFGANVQGYGGGSNTVPVWCDGSYWYIG